MKSKGLNVAVLGATGAVGETMLTVLAERAFPINKIFALSSHRSKGEPVLYKNKQLIAEDAAEFDFSQVDLALFSAGAAVSKEYAERANEAGCLVIDNTSHFRLDPDIPLVIPEVNPEALEEMSLRRIIANPNCSTIQMLVALKPIYDAVGIDRINVATYQSVSGSGRRAIDELSTQVQDLFRGQNVDSEIFPKQIAFNVLPQIGDFLENGYTYEEMKMIWETQKILKDPNIKVNPTAVRVPVFYGHSEAIHIETKEKLTAKQARQLLSNAPGIIVQDERKLGGYPTPIPDASGTDAVYVGRIRDDLSHPLGLNMWVVSDNIRKGAALNAVQIAEILLKEHF